jgi:hypothetical protein
VARGGTFHSQPLARIFLLDDINHCRYLQQILESSDAVAKICPLLPFWYTFRQTQNHGVDHSG